MVDSPSAPVGGPRRIRMGLSEEEAKLVEDFRHRTAVARAFDEGIETAIAVLKAHEISTSQDPILFEAVYHLLERQKRHAKKS